MKNFDFQKMYFIEVHSQYPTLNCNQILLSLINKYEVDKIIFTNSQFSNFKANFKKFKKHAI